MIYLLLTNKALSREIIVVRGNDNYPPYEMNVAGQLVGFHIDLITQVAKTLDMRARFESYPWKRAIYMVREGLVDAISFISETEHRSEFVIFTPGNELSIAKIALIVLKSKKSIFNFNGHNLKTLSHYTFGHNLGFSYGDFYDKSKLNKKTFNTYDQLFSSLRLERIDLALVDYDAFEHFQMSAQGITHKLVALDKKVAIANYIAFSKKMKLQKLSAKFAKAMLEYKKSEGFFALIKKYKLEASKVSNFPL